MEDLKNNTENVEEKSTTNQKRRAPYRKNYRKDGVKKENKVTEKKENTKKGKQNKASNQDLEVKFKKSPVKIIPLNRKKYYSL